MKTRAIRTILLCGLALVIGCRPYAAQADCKPPPSPKSLVLNGLKGVNLYVRVSPGKYVYAVHCHGQEEQCADEALQHSGQSRAEFLKLITDDYRTYSEALHVDNVTRVFGDALRKNLLPYVLPGPDCKTAGLVILNTESGGDYLKNATENDPATLTVAVTIDINDSTKPAIAVLAAHNYRPDPAHSDFWTQVLPHSATAIPRPAKRSDCNTSTHVCWPIRRAATRRRELARRLMSNRNMRRDEVMKTKAIRPILLCGLALLIGCRPFAAQAECKQEAKQSNWTLFRDLKGVNLYVRVPNTYIDAVKCHGREQQCADEVTTSGSAAEYVKFLTDNYRLYREPLRAENLTRVFSDMLTDKLMPFVLPGPDCKPPQIVVLNPVNRGDYLKDATQNDTATLTFAVTLKVEDSASPPIAILTVNYYRPDPTRTSFWTEVLPNYVTAIPLNLPDDQIAALVRKFADHFETPERKGEN